MLLFLETASLPWIAKKLSIKSESDLFYEVKQIKQGYHEYLINIKDPMTLDVFERLLRHVILMKTDEELDYE